MNEKRKCSRCKETKEITEFTKNQYWCKSCWKEYRHIHKIEQHNYFLKYRKSPNYAKKTADYQKTYYKKHLNKIKIYRAASKEKTKIYNKLYTEKNKEALHNKHRTYDEKNKEAVSIRNKIYRQKNSNKIKHIKKQYYEKNKQTILEIHRLYNNKKRKHDINFKIVELLRTRLRNAIKKEWKSAHTLQILGCSIEFLKNHLQQTAFNKGYFDFDINNYSGHQYHIDHITPCSKFNLLCSYHQKLCFNWENLQILKAHDNIIKSDKLAA